MTAPLPPTAPGAPAGEGTQPGQAPATTPPSTTPPAPTGQAPAAPATDLSTLPADVQKIITDARAEAARHRTDKQTATQQAQAAQAERDKILRAMGIKADGTDDADPAEQVAQAQAVAWENALQLQVVRGAGTDYDADALLDSNAFLNSLVDMVEEDPASAAFKAKLAKHVKDFVEANPKFKATPATIAPARSGGDMTPGTPGAPKVRSASLTAAVGQHYKNLAGG